MYPIMLIIVWQINKLNSNWIELVLPCHWQKNNKQLNKHLRLDPVSTILGWKVDIVGHYLRNLYVAIEIVKLCIYAVGVRVHWRESFIYMCYIRAKSFFSITVSCSNPNAVAISPIIKTYSPFGHQNIDFHFTFVWDIWKFYLSLGFFLHATVQFSYNIRNRIIMTVCNEACLMEAVP